MKGKIIFSITVKDAEMILGRKLTKDEIEIFKRKFAIDHWSEEVESFAREHDIDDIETLKLKLREAKDNFENEQQRADNLVDENENLQKQIEKLEDKIMELEESNSRVLELEEYEARCAYAEEQLRDLGLMDLKESDEDNE